MCKSPTTARCDTNRDSTSPELRDPSGHRCLSLSALSAARTSTALLRWSHRVVHLRPQVVVLMSASSVRVRVLCVRRVATGGRGQAMTIVSHSPFGFSKSAHSGPVALPLVLWSAAAVGIHLVHHDLASRALSSPPPSSLPSIRVRTAQGRCLRIRHRALRGRPKRRNETPPGGDAAHCGRSREEAERHNQREHQLEHRCT